MVPRSHGIGEIPSCGLPALKTGGHPEPVGVQAGLSAELRDLLQGRCQARVKALTSPLSTAHLSTPPPAGHSQWPQARTPPGLLVSQVPRTNPTRLLFLGHTPPDLRSPNLLLFGARVHPCQEAVRLWELWRGQDLCPEPPAGLRPLLTSQRNQGGGG